MQHRRSTVNNRELERISKLADRLADRALGALERGELTTDEFRNSPDVALLLQAAQLLLSAGREFPPTMRSLAAQAAQQLGPLIEVRGSDHQLPALILIVLASACSTLGIVSRSTPFARLASIFSASKSPESVKSHSKSPIWYSW